MNVHVVPWVRGLRRRQSYMRGTSPATTLSQESLPPQFAVNGTLTGSSGSYCGQLVGVCEGGLYLPSFFTPFSLPHDFAAVARSSGSSQRAYDYTFRVSPSEMSRPGGAKYGLGAQTGCRTKESLSSRFAASRP